MTTLLPSGSYQIYTSTDDLREKAIPFAVSSVQPSEGDREELILNKLGSNGWGRLHHFRSYYSQGWGDHGGKPLSPSALECFYRFLEEVKFPKEAKPSLFLTDEGCLELCWKDIAQKNIQIEFQPNQIEYYIESMQLEENLNFDSINELVGLVSEK